MNSISDIRGKNILLNKVPEITALFWITKVLTTGMGEVFSDFLVKTIGPVIVVVLGGIGLITFLIPVILQACFPPVDFLNQSIV